MSMWAACIPDRGDTSSDGWAVSCKSSQWIPGLILTEMARKLRSDLPVVIGGIASKGEAQTLMRVFPQSDLAIWGEGEGPLLALVRQMEAATPDLDKVPRLLYRHAGDLHQSPAQEEESQSLTRDDFSDFFETLAQMPGPADPNIEVSLNTARGCTWGRCRFCTLHQNLSTRYKEPAQVIEEIRVLVTRYGVKKVHFANQDIQGRDLQRFEELLDRLFKLRSEEEMDVEFSADITAARLSSTNLRKMASAGFNYLLVGFEAMTDRMLDKVDKPHRFAHNIYFLKLMDKYKIRNGANLLIGGPDETREDVLESIHNLHYLRFYPPGTRGALWIVPMYLGVGAPYLSTMSDIERARWVIDDPASVYEFLPESIVQLGDPMHLGYFRAPLKNPDLWGEFRILINAYQNARREYHWFAKGAEVLLQERHNGTIVKEFSLEPEYYQVLRLANDEVIDVHTLCQRINTSCPDMQEPRLKEIVQDLKSEYLLYADDAYQTIISVVDTDGGPPAG
jgi:radical SAM superfamily enzyme YgiQ (UPF0313 family)